MVPRRGLEPPRLAALVPEFPANPAFPPIRSSALACRGLWEPCETAPFFGAESWKGPQKSPHTAPVTGRLLVYEELRLHGLQYGRTVPAKALVHPAKISQRQPFAFALRFDFKASNRR